MDIFHVHTYRCGHAEMIKDEVYINKAIDLRANAIVFTDHAPFPGNPFRNRMEYSELPEYISTLKNLKKKYDGIIDVKIGLEIEYLPSFMEYYQELKKCDDLELLMIGQHFYEVEPGVYSFSFPEFRSQEYKGCLEQAIAGMNTGMFQVIAHPDRAFRRVKQWELEHEELSKKVIAGAAANNVLLEQNFSSMQTKNYYWPEFWKLVGAENETIRGIDAHSVEDIEKAVLKFRCKRCR